MRLVLTTIDARVSTAFVPIQAKLHSTRFFEHQLLFKQIQQRPFFVTESVGVFLDLFFDLVFGFGKLGLSLLRGHVMEVVLKHGGVHVAFAAD